MIGDYERFEETNRGSTTYRDVRSTAEFVVNVPTTGIVEQLNRAGAPAPDKFAASGLTAGPSSVVAAPSVTECIASFECRLESISNHRWLGEIIHGRVVAARVRAPSYQAMEPRGPAPNTRTSLSPHLRPHQRGLLLGGGAHPG